MIEAFTLLKVLDIVIFLGLFYFSIQIFIVLKKAGKKTLVSFLAEPKELGNNLTLLCKLFLLFIPFLLLMAANDLCKFYNWFFMSFVLYTLSKIIFWGIIFRFSLLLLKWLNRFKVFR